MGRKQGADQASRKDLACGSPPPGASGPPSGTSCTLRGWQLCRRVARSRSCRPHHPGRPAGQAIPSPVLALPPEAPATQSPSVKLDTTPALGGLGSLPGSPYLFLNCNIRGWIKPALEICIPHKYQSALYTERFRWDLHTRNPTSADRQRVCGPPPGTLFTGGCFSTQTFNHGQLGSTDCAMPTKVAFSVCATRLDIINPVTCFHRG